MAKNPLFELREHGQSVWYDSISRGMISSGNGSIAATSLRLWAGRTFRTT